MLRVLLCCMGGFSSSAMVEHVKAEISKSEYADKVAIEFYPFELAYEKLGEVDAIMTCPHLKYSVPKFVEKYHPEIPLYVLPPKLYGAMTPKSIYEDITDVIEGFKKDGRNPWCFPGEESNLKIQRRVSHREWEENNH